MKIDREVVILVSSFFVLCIVAAAMTANSKTLISAIKSSNEPQFPTEKLLSSIPDGCVVVNRTLVKTSIFNSGYDTILNIRCIE